MIWILLGISPLVALFAWLFWSEWEAMLMVLGTLAICAAMSFSIVYGLYEIGVLK